ncbi:MAG: ParB/RepB/Spo0J family partition protein [Candidatus Saccharimonadales bacterium]
MSNNHKGLGRGLDALIPANFDQSILLDEKDRIQKILISDIQPNQDQPRKNFDQTRITELAYSIKRFGVLQPLIVTPNSNGFTIVAGERRWRAAQVAQLERVPAIVRESKELEQLEIAIVENVQRVDLSPLEQAKSIERLHQQFSFTYKQISDRLGKAVPTINNIVRLLQLPPEAYKALEMGTISEGHARSILSLKQDPVKQLELLNGIIRNGWSVRQAEQYVLNSKQITTSSKTIHDRMAVETKETKKLSKALNTKVSLRRTAHGGKLEIHFKDDGELQLLLNRFTNL